MPMEELEGLKTLDQALKLKRCPRLQSLPDLKPFLHKNTLKDSIKVLGCHTLPDEQHHIICTSAGIYFFHQDALKAVQLFDSCCLFYLYSERDGHNGTTTPLHVTFMNNGSVIAFGIEKERFRKYTSFDIPSDLLDNRVGFVAAASSQNIYISLDCQSILYVGAPTKLFKLEMGKLLTFFFMDDNSLLFYLYRHAVVGDLWVGVACETSPQIRASSMAGDLISYSQDRSHSFMWEWIPISKFQLRTSDQADCRMIKLDDSYAIAVTSRYTYILKIKNPLIIIKNRGSLNLESSIHVTGSLSDNKSGIRDRINLCVFDSSGIMSTTSFRILPKPPQAIRWEQTPLVAGQSFEQGELKFATRLSTGSSRENPESFLVVSNLTGCGLVDRKTGSMSTILPGSSKKVFDGNCIPTPGSDLDTYLLCGSFTEIHGFIEKYSLLSKNDRFEIISEQRLLHKPVVNLWCTDKGLLYESIDALYSADTNKKVCSFGQFVWYTRHDVLIDEFEETTLSVSEVAITTEGAVCCLAVISGDGVLKVLDVRNNEKSCLIFSIKLGSSMIRNPKSSVLFCSSDSHYYSVCYHTHGFLNLFRDSSAIGQISIELDWFVFDILLKSIGNVIYVITTSMDGRARIFQLSSGECLLEISSASKTKFQLLSLGTESDGILFYNEHECILTHLEGMVYGKLDLGFHPLKIVPRKARKNDSVFYALDHQGSLKTVEFPSQMDVSSLVPYGEIFDLHDCVPLRILPGFRPSLAAVAVKDQKRGVLRAILFDYDNMRIVDKHDFGAKSGDFSDVLLQSFDHEVIHSEPLRLFLKRFFLLCCTTPNESFVYIFRISDCKLELLQVERLCYFVLSISLIQGGTRILFGGTQAVIYNLKPDFKNSTVMICNGTHIEKPILKHLKAPFFFSCKDNWGTVFSLVGETCQVHFPSGNEEACLVNSHNKLDRSGRNLIVKVASKRLSIRDRYGLFPKSRDEKASFVSSESIIQSLSAPNKNDFADYWVTVDCGGYVNLYKGLTNNPEREFRLESRVLNVSPIMSQYSGFQLDAPKPSVQKVWPLFMIACEDGHIYTLGVSDSPNSVRLTHIA